MSFIGQTAVAVTGNVAINDTNGVEIDPATANDIALLQRMVKLLESQSACDIGNRQRITLDNIAAGLTLATVSTVTTVTTVSTVSNISAGTLTNLGNVAGYNQAQYIDVTRNTYSNAIRNKLTFT
jgi:hypothetical protein